MTLRILTWILCFACTVVAGVTGAWFVGDLNANGWAAPAFAPPAWVFGPVWSLLYLMIATAGYFVLTAREASWKPLAIGLWALQICLNTLWTPVFFGAHDLWGALLIIFALWLSIGAFSGVAWRVDRRASALFLPYWAWVSFATVLNYGYILANPGI